VLELEDNHEEAQTALNGPWSIQCTPTPASLPFETISMPKELGRLLVKQDSHH
jgi:hypothetical protein